VLARPPLHPTTNGEQARTKKIESSSSLREEDNWNPRIE
jgi:hypothetical protein